MAQILILFSTTDGHTLKICRRMEATLSEQGHQVAVVNIGDAALLDLDRFDKIVIGASIRYGKHSPQVVDFIGRNRDALERRPNAFFSVNLVARKPDKNRPDTNPYLRRFLQQISWKPQQLAVFAGKLDYPRYGFADRLVIRLIMWITKGPTDPTTVKEFTDWEEVDGFARLVAGM